MGEQPKKQALCIQTYRIGEKEKAEFRKQCTDRGVSTGTILRKLTDAWIKGDIKFEV